MDTTHPIRVVLFWNLEHARDMYSPYFTEKAKKTWIFTRMVTHDQLVRKILKHQGMDPNFWHVYLWTVRPDISKDRIHVLVEFELIQSQTFSEMVSDKPSMLYPNVEEDDEEDDSAYEEYDVSSESDNDNNPNDEEYDISTPSSQWFSNTLYDYTSSRAFLDMGSGEQIDDLIESSTIRLQDWNDAMIDLQLGIRFVDKIQAISAVQKWSIRTGREFKVVKRTHMPCSSSSKQASKYDFKIYFKININILLPTIPRSLSRTLSKKCKYYFKQVVRTRGRVVTNGKNIHCLMLMCRTYIREKLIDEHTNPIFIRLGTRTFGEMLLTI
ncbi:hypothetical protein M9H77_31493 [Catharanthus roseus]|uniref:Uncharacterized protein n=1 Tax=Catharanthus roseus TaxID=4058 RepID=A0ACC0A168_CATRO|nr:hypothetical protein M9H77_31493 [Catharanthus roseus]